MRILSGTNGLSHQLCWSEGEALFVGESPTASTAGTPVKVCHFTRVLRLGYLISPRSRTKHQFL
jgi:hypothetical protein